MKCKLDALWQPCEMVSDFYNDASSLLYTLIEPTWDYCGVLWILISKMENQIKLGFSRLKKSSQLELIEPTFFLGYANF